VLLLTHDRVWFELAQLSITNRDNWVYYEMYNRQVRTGSIVFDAPVLTPQLGPVPEHFIKLAKQYLGPPNHDLRAAALYARAALETKLKSYCNNNKIQVPYDLDGRKLNTDHFLKAIERRLVWEGKMPLALFQVQRIKLFRYGVLNPFAHFHPVTLATSEIESALQAVESLDFGVKETDFAAKASSLVSKAALSWDERRDAACFLRTAFEVDLRGLLVRDSGTLVYRDDWAKIGAAELWESAKATMIRVNNVLAGPLISDIERHPALFLNDWKYPSVSALTKPDLDAAWNAIRVPAPARPETRLATFA
jgi:hypothetical protein